MDGDPEQKVRCSCANFSPACCATSGKSQNVSGPPFSDLQSEDDSRATSKALSVLRCCDSMFLSWIIRFLKGVTGI